MSGSTDEAAEPPRVWVGDLPARLSLASTCDRGRTGEALLSIYDACRCKAHRRVRGSTGQSAAPTTGV